MILLFTFSVLGALQTMGDPQRRLMNHTQHSVHSYDHGSHSAGRPALPSEGCLGGVLGELPVHILIQPF